MTASAVRSAQSLPRAIPEVSFILAWPTSGSGHYSCLHRDGHRLHSQRCRAKKLDLQGGREPKGQPAGQWGIEVQVCRACWPAHDKQAEVAPLGYQADTARSSLDMSAPFLASSHS